MGSGGPLRGPYEVGSIELRSRFPRDQIWAGVSTKSGGYLTES